LACLRDTPTNETERGTIVFTIRLLDGEEVSGTDADKLSINEETGIVSISRIDGFEEVTTHYSPSAWGSVTHRVKEIAFKKVSA
jgi:hypothetical protein